MALKKDDIQIFLLEILNTVKQLVALLQKENKALKANKLKEAQLLQEKKQNLLAILNTFDTNIKDIEEIKTISKNILDDFALQSRNLQKELYLNEVLIKIKLDINMEFLKNIKEQLNLQYKNQIGYNNKGNLLSDKKLAQIMPYLTINNKV